MSKVGDIQTRVEQLSKEISRAEGERDTYMRQLKKEFKCGSIEEGQALLEKMEKQLKKDERRLEKETTDFEEKWTDVLKTID